MTDEQLVRASQAGDANALETLYKRYLPVIWRFACARLRGEVHAAEDVTSETFLAAVDRIHYVDLRKGLFVAWLMGIARRKVADAKRRRMRSERALQAIELQPGEDCPAASLEEAECRQAVIAVLERVRDDERLVLEWKHVEGLTVREIAGRLGKTEKAVEALLYRARCSFRRVFLKRKQPLRRTDNGG